MFTKCLPVGLGVIKVTFTVLDLNLTSTKTNNQLVVFPMDRWLVNHIFSHLDTLPTYLDPHTIVVGTRKIRMISQSLL